MEGWFVSVSINKADTEGTDTVIARIAENINDWTIPYNDKTEANTLSYVMKSSDAYVKPSLDLMLYDKFHFFISPYSSYYCTGTYRLEQGYVILETDDGLYTYVFKEDGNNLIFDAEKSSEIQKFKPSANSEAVAPVQDGDVFVKV